MEKIKTSENPNLKIPSSNKISRRRFLLSGFTILFSGVFLSFGDKIINYFSKIKISHFGPDPLLGHKLWRKPIKKESVHTKEIEVLILGAGVSALSAAWRLEKNSFQDYEIVDMQDRPGGNSLWGDGLEVGYPTGAHYVPVPGVEAKSVRQLFLETGIFTSINKKGLPVIPEVHLLREPQNKLYIYSSWQNTELPLMGATHNDSLQFQRFQKLMHYYKELKGPGGGRSFVIPIEKADCSEEILALDKISMASFLTNHNFTSPSLKWYVDYACRDDFGSVSERVSAFMGIHYFASRNAYHSRSIEDGEYLVWPEGNGYIVKKILELLSVKPKTGMLVRSIGFHKGIATVILYNKNTKEQWQYKAKKVIYALPLHQLPYLVSNKKLISHISIPPMSVWLIANIFLKDLPEYYWANFSWDNNIYNSSSLGFVYANHQSLQSRFAEHILTHYRVYTDEDELRARRKLLFMSDSEVRDTIVKELSTVYPGIEDYVKRIEIVKRGHAMAIPTVGSIWNGDRKQNAKAIANMEIAHSDLAGYSIFEEANYFGVRAAENTLAKMGYKIKSLL